MVPKDSKRSSGLCSIWRFIFVFLITVVLLLGHVELVQMNNLFTQTTTTTEEQSSTVNSTTTSIDSKASQPLVETWLETMNRPSQQCEFVPIAVPQGYWFSSIQPDPKPEFSLLSAWLKSERASGIAAPKQIPETYKNEFTMDGKVQISDFYFNQAYLGGTANSPIWTEQMIDNLIEKASKREEMKYGKDGLRIHDGMMKYNKYITNQRGIVIGSEDPWVEAICLYHGAKQLLTVEFGTIQCTHPKVTTMIPKDFTESFLNGKVQQFDFGISFSSLEHDGLGRYGDHLNPIGDLQSMAKMLSVIKPGGFFFLGFPSAEHDKLEFNAHRIYGKYRLPKIFAGWRFVDIIFDNPQGFQQLFVLQNTYGCIP